MTDNVFDIRTGRVVTNPKVASATAPAAARLVLGTTVENGALRAHRYRDHIVLWDLTNAGKRGKKVAKLNVCPSYTLSSTRRDEVLEQVAVMVEALRSFNVAGLAISEYAATYPHTLDLAMSEERGVDVRSADAPKITINAPKLTLEADTQDFTVRCLVDQHNCPTCISPTKSPRKAVAAFYRWASENQDRIKAMSYRDVLNELGQLGIRYHDFYAMD